MACHVVKLPGIQGAVMVCGPRHKAKPCSVCKRRPGTHLCDGLSSRSQQGQLFTETPSKTCDAPLCEVCSKTADNHEHDYCPVHAGAVVKKPMLPLEPR